MPAHVVGVLIQCNCAGSLQSLICRVCCWIHECECEALALTKLAHQGGNLPRISTDPLLVDGIQSCIRSKPASGVGSSDAGKYGCGTCRWLPDVNMNTNG